MMGLKRVVTLVATAVVLAALPATTLANGIGEGRSFQFRSDSQRQVLLSLERTRLELLGLLGGTGTGGTGGGSGQTGNATNITVTGSNNTISVVQTNTGNQTQDTDCSGATFNITGGMFGC